MKKVLFILAPFVAAGLLLPVYGLARSITLNPTDDAFVFSVNPTWNYGAGSSLVVNKAFSGSQLTQERQAYLKFDLTSLAGINPADITSVVLHLYVTTSAGGQVVAYHSPDIYSTSSDAWVEGNGTGGLVPGITWNNKPSLAGAPLMGTSPNLTPNNAYYPIDLLAGGKGWIWGDLCDHWLSLALLLPDSVNTSTAYYFNSLEASGNHPYLEVQVADNVPGTVGVYDNGVWYVDLNRNGAWDTSAIDDLYYFGGGLTGALPLFGDWTGTGGARIGVYWDGVWYLDLNGCGAWDGTPTDALYYFGGGLTGAIPVTGDWTGTGATKIGVYHNGVWYLDLSGNGAWDGTPTDGLHYFGGGLTGAIPVTGDWTGTGATKIGVYHNGVWYLDLNGNGGWDGTPTDGLYPDFGIGLTGAVPVTGDWTGTGITRIGVYWDGLWYLDLNGNGAWDGTPTDGLDYFGGGLTGAIPVAGK
jgi:hypothetical protein